MLTLVPLSSRVATISCLAPLHHPAKESGEGAPAISSGNIEWPASRLKHADDRCPLCATDGETSYRISPFRMATKVTPKHQEIYQTIKGAIASGKYKTGQRLPSEAVLGKTFSASRMTVNRALRELQLGGIIDRR